MLNHNGEVAECTGDNIFLVKHGVLQDAADRRRHPRRRHAQRRHRAGPRRPSIPCQEMTLTRHDVYTADECFLTGTARRGHSRGEVRRPRHRHRQARPDHAAAARALPRGGSPGRGRPVVPITTPKRVSDVPQTTYFRAGHCDLSFHLWWVRPDRRTRRRGLRRLHPRPTADAPRLHRHVQSAGRDGHDALHGRARPRLAFCESDVRRGGPRNLHRPARGRHRLDPHETVGASCPSPTACSASSSRDVPCFIRSPA